MQIKYVVEKEIHRSKELVLEEIYSKLEKLGTDSVEKSNNFVSFENSFWKEGSTMQHYNRINKGNFKIVKRDKHNFLVYTYFVSGIGELVIVILCIFMGLFQSYFFFLFCLIIIIEFLSRISNLKRVSSAFIEDIS